MSSTNNPTFHLKRAFLDEYDRFCRSHGFYIAYSFSDEPFIADLDDNELFGYHLKSLKENL